MPYPTGPVLAANEVKLIVGSNPARRSLQIQNQGGGTVVFNFWPPQHANDGWIVEPNGTLADTGDQVHRGDWYGRETDGISTTLRVIEA